MRKFYVSILFTLVVLVSYAQKRTYDTIPYILEYHQQRIALFEKEPMTKGAIVFLGNSITEAGNWKKLLKDSSVVNRGIAGDNTFGVLGRLDEVIEHQPSKLFIKIGINDIGQGVPDAVIVKNIMTMVIRVKKGSPHTHVYVQSLLPTNDAAKEEYPSIFNKNGNVVSVNNQLMKSASKNGFTYIDLYSRFKDKDGKLDAKYATDGLHINELGYQLWIEILLKRKYL